MSDLAFALNLTSANIINMTLDCRMERRVIIAPGRYGQRQLMSINRLVQTRLLDDPSNLLYQALDSFLNPSFKALPKYLILIFIKGVSITMNDVFQIRTNN